MSCYYQQVMTNIFLSLFFVIVLFGGDSYQKPTSRIIQNFRSSFGDERYPELSSRMFEGDILIMPGEDAKNAVVYPRMRWPGGIVTYDFTSNYTETERDKVLRSMNVIESNTCIKFQERKNDEAYILINKMAGRGCYALVGYSSNMSPMPVNLQSPECLAFPGTIQHELLHVLGLLHEQSRNDRDDFVEIVWDNVEEVHYSDFSKAMPGSTTTYNIPYNTMSVMHYPKMAFSKNGKPTIISKKNPEMEMGQRGGVTEGDLEKVRRMYKCKNPNGGDSESNNHIPNIFNVFNIFKA